MNGPMTMAISSFWKQEVTGSSPAAEAGYTSEDETTVYTTEDGAAVYVPEA